MRTETITCDACGKDLTYTGNSIDWRLALTNERIPSYGGAVTMVMKYQAIPSDTHFCGVNCLYKWMDVRRERR